jgi:hypothetical protein
MPPERRGSFRFELLPQVGRVWLGQAARSAHLVDLSAGGGLLQIDGARPLPAGEHVAEFRLAGLPAFLATILPVRQGRLCSALVVPFRFLRLGSSALPILTRFLVERHLESCRRASGFGAGLQNSLGRFERRPVLETLIQHTVWSGQPLRLVRKDRRTPWVGRVRDLTVEAARQLLVVELDKPQPSIAGQELFATFCGPGALYCFDTTAWRASGSTAWLTAPGSIRLAGFRGSQRASPPPSESLRISLRHPRDPNRVIERQVLELSARGLSFVLEPERDLLFPGEHISEVTAHLAGATVTAEAILRSMRDLGGARLACGLELVAFAGPADAERWQRLALRLTHPAIELIGRDEVGQAWQALRDSGYVDLLEAGQEGDLRARFLSAWSRHAESPQVSRFFLVRRDQRPVATAAASLVYPRTWMPHLFGIDRQERADRTNLYEHARVVNLGMMHLLQHLTDSDHFVFYFDSQKPFHDLVFGRFLAGYPRKDEFLYDSFRLYRMRPGEASQALEPEDGIEVVEADSALLDRLAAHLQRQLAPIEVVACAYRREEIALEAFSRRCAALDYERQRQIFFALVHGTPKAALLVETGFEGLNVFGLLDRCWCFGLVPSDEVSWPCLVALLQRAVGYYAARGRRSFLYQDSRSTDLSPALAGLGCGLVASGRRWLGSGRIIPAFSNHVSEVMGMARAQVARSGLAEQ